MTSPHLVELIKDRDARLDIAPSEVDAKLFDTPAAIVAFRKSLGIVRHLLEKVN